MSEYVWREPASKSVPGSAASSGMGRNLFVPAARDKSRAGRRNLVFASAAALAILVLAYVFAWIPFTEVKELNIVGNSALSDSELAVWMGIPAKTSIFSLDADAVARSVMGNPRVREASLTKRFPSTLLVTIVERQPLALVYARDADGRISAHCVDSQGIVYAAPDSVLDRDRLPILSGIEIRSLRYGMKLDDRILPVLASLEKLSKDNVTLLSGISELRVLEKTGSGIEVLLYPLHYRVPVRLGVDFDAELMKTVLLVLDVVEARGLSPNILELDFRNDTFVYRTKEAVPG